MTMTKGKQQLLEVQIFNEYRLQTLILIEQLKQLLTLMPCDIKKLLNTLLELPPLSYLADAEIGTKVDVDAAELLEVGRILSAIAFL